MAGARQGADQTITTIGLLGGSFNPAHGGHRRISLFVHQALALEEVWWLVSPGNPLKPKAGMAPLAARYASARAQSRRAPIRPTIIERDLATRYTLDTLRALTRRYRKHSFVWIMGADNLAQFHRWRDWRAIARLMPIAVVARPGYDAAALKSPAMAFFRQFRGKNQRPTAAPRLRLLRFDPDARSASALRAAHPDWAQTIATSALRDALTHRPISCPKR